MFFENAAYAQQAGTQAGAAGGLMSFLPIILMVLIFYFLLIRPQQKRQKQHAAMVDALKAGDTILTNGGMIGTIHSVNGNVVLVDFGNARIQILKGYIADKVDPNTLETASNEPVKENK